MAGLWEDHHEAAYIARVANGALDKNAGRIHMVPLFGAFGNCLDGLSSG